MGCWRIASAEQLKQKLHLALVADAGGRCSSPRSAPGRSPFKESISWAGECKCRARESQVRLGANMTPVASSWCFGALRSSSTEPSLRRRLVPSTLTRPPLRLPAGAEVCPRAHCSDHLQGPQGEGIHVEKPVVIRVRVLVVQVEGSGTCSRTLGYPQSEF